MNHNNSNLAHPADPIPDQVFDLLKRRGPLCQSQLSAELMVGARKIDAVLRQLETEGVVEPRPDRHQVNQIEQPWGLPKPSRRR